MRTPLVLASILCGIAIITLATGWYITHKGVTGHPSFPIPNIALMASSTASSTMATKTSNVSGSTTSVPLQSTGATSTRVTPAGSSEIMAWLYPSKTICTAQAEYSDGRTIQFLKPQYFTVSADDGSLTLLTQANSGCNGYSAANLASVRAHSTYQFVTVSSGIDGLQALTASDGTETQAINTLTTFAVQNNVTGIEIDFEDFGSWDAPTYQAYLAFLQKLGTSLHAQNKELMVDVPPISGSLEQSYYPLTYKEIAALPVDYIVVMAYDYQFDQGAGQPIAPNSWVVSVIQQAKQYIPTSRLVIGIPSYAYSASVGSFKISRKTYAQLESVPGFSTAVRDATSNELQWTSDGIVYDYVDSTGLDAKRALIEAQGIKYISVWALGGNQWF